MIDSQTASEILGVDEDVVMYMAEMTRTLAVLDAVVFTNSTDVDTLAEWMYENKDRVAPIEFCRAVAEEYLPVLVEQGMLIDGVPTDEATLIAQHHQAMLNNEIQ